MMDFKQVCGGNDASKQPVKQPLGKPPQALSEQHMQTRLSYYIKHNNIGEQHTESDLF